MSTPVLSPFRSPDAFLAFDAGARERLGARAGASPRRRAHALLHAGHQDPVQRLVVWLKADTYVPPHRHPERWELAVRLVGALDVLLFDDTGRLAERHRLHEACPLVEIPAGTWHTYAVVDGDEAAFLEVKAGPHADGEGTEFAPFAPGEGAPEEARAGVVEALRGLLVGASLAPSASRDHTGLEAV